MELHPDVIQAIRGVEPGVRHGFERAIRKNHASFLAQKALYAGTLVESGGRNLSYGDRDSVGALQQRPSQGWTGLRNPERAADEFLSRAKQYIKAHPGAKSGEVAQGVQRSAFPGRYSESGVQGAAQRLARGGGKTSGSSGPGALSQDRTSVTLGPTKTIPGQSFENERTAARRQLVSGGHMTLRRLLDYKSQVDQLQDVPERKVRGDLRVKHTQSAVVLPKRGPARIKITGANTNRLTKPVVSFMRRLSQTTGEQITGDSGASHSRLTVNGNVRQRSTGDAVDIPATGARLLRLGRQALILAGMPRKEAMKAKGGLYNVNGKQVIFLTNEGGNHYNHLHYGD